MEEIATEQQLKTAIYLGMGDDLPNSAVVWCYFIIVSIDPFIKPLSYKVTRTVLSNLLFQFASELDWLVAWTITCGHGCLLV